MRVDASVKLGELFKVSCLLLLQRQPHVTDTEPVNGWLVLENYVLDQLVAGEDVDDQDVLVSNAEAIGYEDFAFSIVQEVPDATKMLIAMLHICAQEEHAALFNDCQLKLRVAARIERDAVAAHAVHHEAVIAELNVVPALFWLQKQVAVLLVEEAALCFGALWVP